MFDLIKFIRLRAKLKQRKFREFFELYEKTAFGDKYKLLANMLLAFAYLNAGEKGKAEKIFKDLYPKLTAYEYYNTDTRIYLSNYIFYYTHIAGRIDNFYIDASERPLNIDKVDKFIRSTFFHNTRY